MGNVKDFGAKGDGLADETAAIQHAIDAGDGVLHFPPGRYRITATLRVDLTKRGPVAVDGSGGTARLRMEAAGPAILLKGDHERTADPSHFRPEEWERQRMPTVRDLEIEGAHPEADGIRIEGVMQPTLTGLLIREGRTAVHVTGRARNVLISACHFYHGRGVGIHLEKVNLHQTIVTGSHVSYFRRGGLRIEGSEIRNLQITGNDIEYNNHKSYPGAEPEPTAEILIDVREGTVREGTISGNTLQATGSPGGANVRFLGAGPNVKGGMWAISGNLIGSQEVNLELTAVSGIAVSGNHIYSGHRHNILARQCSQLAVGANVLGHNADYGDNEIGTGARFEGCTDTAIGALVVKGSRAGKTTVAEALPAERLGLLELVDCRRVTVTGAQLTDPAPYGLYGEGGADIVITGCSILEARAEKLMKAAVMWKGDVPGAILSSCRVGRGTEGAIIGVPGLIADNVVD